MSRYTAWIRGERADGAGAVLEVLASPDIQAATIEPPAVVSMEPVRFVAERGGYSASLLASDDPAWQTSGPMPYVISIRFVSSDTHGGLCRCGCASMSWAVTRRYVLMLESLEELWEGTSGWDLARMSPIGDTDGVTTIPVPGPKGPPGPPGGPGPPGEVTLEDGDARWVNLDGDTMTGALTVTDLNAAYLTSRYGADMGGYRITSVADPEAGSDAATKGYVDAFPGGATTLDGLTDVTAPTDTPAGKVLGTTAEGVWEPVDPPDSGVRQVESGPVEPTDPERLIWINTDAEPEEPEPVIMPGGVFAIHRGFINAGPIGAVTAGSIYTWRVTLPGDPVILQAFATWRFWSTPALGFSPTIGSGIRAATAQVLHTDSAPGVLNITAHFPQAGTPDARAGAFEGISWMALTEADFS